MARKIEQALPVLREEELSTVSGGSTSFTNSPITLNFGGYQATSFGDKSTNVAGDDNNVATGHSTAIRGKKVDASSNLFALLGIPALM